MKPPDPNKNGGPVSETAAHMEAPTAKSKAAVGGELVNADLEPIGIDESADFIRLEKVIERGLDTFVEVGNALAEIRDRRLYRCEYKTFEDYCRDKWNMGRTYAHRLMAAAETVEMLPVGNKPTSERQVRALAKLPAEQRPEAWQRAVDRAEGGQPTAVVVEAVVEEVAAKPAKRAARPRGQALRLTFTFDGNVISAEPLRDDEQWSNPTISVIAQSKNDLFHRLKTISATSLSNKVWRAASTAEVQP